MQLSTQDFIKAVLLKESLEHSEAIRAALLPLYERHSNCSRVNMLTVTMMLVAESKQKSLESCLEYITKNFSKVISIVEEYGVKLPEEEVQLEQIVKAIAEEGEGAAPAGDGGASDVPANVTAGIEPTTPRIYRNKKRKEEDTDVPVIARKSL